MLLVRMPVLLSLGASSVVAFGVADLFGAPRTRQRSLEYARKALSEYKPPLFAQKQLSDAEQDAEEGDEHVAAKKGQ